MILRRKSPPVKRTVPSWRIAWIAGATALGFAVQAHAQGSLVAMAEKGDPDAQYLVGLAYLKGEEIERNRAAGVKLLRYAMRQGHPEARYKLATMLRDGTDVAPRANRAVTLFFDGANAGHAESQLALGEMMIMGLGTERDEQGGLYWIDKAAAQNLPRAQGVLGELIYEGRGTETNLGDAYYLLILAGDEATPHGQALRKELSKKLRPQKKAVVHARVQTFRADHPPRPIAQNRLSGIPLVSDERGLVVVPAEESVPELSAEVAAQRDEAERRVNAGIRAGDAAEVTAGAALADAVLAVDAEEPRALRTRGQAFAFEGRDEEARRALVASLERDPASADAHLLLGQVLIRLEDDGGASRELARVLQLDSTRTEARVELARLHHRTGDFASASTQARLVLENESDAEMRQILVESLLAMNRTTEAFLALQAIPDEERDESVYIAMGRIEVERGRPAAGRTWFEKALALDPHDVEALEGLLAADIAASRLPASIARIDAALAARPDDPSLHRLRGAAASAAGRPAEAETHFESALEKDPHDLATLVALARLQEEEGRAEVALRTYERALVVAPDDSNVRYARASLLVSLGRREAAIADYEAAVTADATHGAARGDLAKLLLEDPDDLERALELAEEARTLMPGDPGPAETLGRVHYERGDMLAAIRYLRRAETGLPSGSAERAEVRYLLGRAYVADGNLTQGRETLKGALAEIEGNAGSEPAWAGDAREVLVRLGSAR
jgi:TPR repeat protein